MKNWTPPADWHKITTIDTHTEGEPLRIIIDGYPDLPGDTILERRRTAKTHLDHLRTSLMFEPRGHADMYGCIVTPPVSPQADIGVLFLHNEGYSTMCGHGIIAITKVVLETGLLPMQPPESTVKIDTSAGLVTAHARVVDGQVQSVYFHNVPSFVVALDEVVDVPGLGKIKYDLAFGGAFYAYVQAEQVGRDPDTIGLECWVSMGQGSAKDWRTEIETWRNVGATHIALNTIHNRGHLNAISGSKVTTHLKAIETYVNAVGDLF